MNYDVIIIGGGAAGLFCAIEAGKRGRNVLVIEHNASVGRKIIISGGGRCNFTNINSRPENFISKNPHFCKSAFARYSARDFVELVRKHDIKFHEKKLGQLFCDESSLKIVEMLLTECKRANVEIRLNCSVSKILKAEAEVSGTKNDLNNKPAARFEIETNHEHFSCESLVIACGGLSIPKIGATDLGYQTARQFGLRIVETRPALVPFTFQNSFPEGFKKLTGVSLDVNVSTPDISFRENILFTHRGLSGPAILQISSYMNSTGCISIDLLPEIDVMQRFEESKDSRKTLANFLSEMLPSRFSDVWVGEYFENKPLKGFSEKEFGRVAEKLSNWEICIGGTEGYAKAEVTAGGVSTDELSSKTMESKRVKGLYFIGEVVDVTGWLGGYNFQWAWSSGFAAGQFV